MRIGLYGAVAGLGILGGCLLTGCGLSDNSVPSLQAFEMAGSVRGGALPINGSHIYLYAAGTLGNAGPSLAASSSNASGSLLVSAANSTADANGNYYVTGATDGTFSLGAANPGCTTGQELYLYSYGGNARGGDPNGTGTNNGSNGAIGLMTALGVCENVGTSSHVIVNEMSTVAAAYALAGFATDSTHVSDDEGLPTNTSRAQAKTGMANAMSNAANLVPIATGLSLSQTPGGNGMVPAATLNTIANILADCVQNTGPAAAPCTNLFSFTGSATTADVATAAINMAHNPRGSASSLVTVSTLFNGLEANTAFQPNLTRAPNDLGVAITYTGGGITAPSALAIDFNGSVWLPDQPTNAVIELAGTNASYTATSYTSGGLTAPTAIAIDASGAAWVANSASVTQLSGSGTSYTGTNYGSGTVNAPSGIAVDGNGVIWVPHSTGIAYLQASGASYTVASHAADSGLGDVAIDASNQAWVPVSSGALYRYSLSGAGLSFYRQPIYTDTPTNVAINNDGTVWVQDTYTATGPDGNKTFTVLKSTANNTYTESASSVAFPYSSFVLDTFANPWTICAVTAASVTSTEICHLDPADTSTVLRLQGTTPDKSGAAALVTDTAGTDMFVFDGSGNVWVTNQTNVLEFVGAGQPTVTPLVQGVVAGKIASRP